MSDVIANCACCGGKAKLVGVGNHSWWICPNVACGIVGPINDFDGAKWNALMRGRVPDAPKEGTVRVRGKVWLDDHGTWNLSGAQWWKPEEWNSNDRWPIIGFITADLPLPQPVEVVGRASE